MLRQRIFRSLDNDTVHSIASQLKGILQRGVFRKIFIGQQLVRVLNDDPLHRVIVDVTQHPIEGLRAAGALFVLFRVGTPSSRVLELLRVWVLK